jgi:hypothetical protein
VSALPLVPLLGTAVVGVLVVALGRWLAGARGWLARPGDGAGFRLVVCFAAGAVVFHLLLAALQAAGLAWSRASVSTGVALLLGAGVALGRGAFGRPAARTERARIPSDWGWGDGLALFALALFACFALAAWVATPDFVYHWGLKGERYFLSGGIDYADLGRVWNDVIHPDYPNLLPELYAASALAAGRFAEPAMMLWSCFFFALLLLGAREELRQAGCRRFVRQAALALVALATAAFALGGRMAGAADWLIALVLVAAAPLLGAAPSPASDRQLGALAALAAAAKVEGVPLAIFLIAAALLLPRAARRRPAEPAVTGSPRRFADFALPAGAWSPRRLARLALPAAVVALPWYFEVHRHHLFQEFNSGPFDLARAPRVAAALATTMGDPTWHGFTWALALLPLVWLDRRVRALASVAAAQLVFYFYVYFTVRIDAAALLLASFPRLMLHLIPAILVAAAVTAERAARADGGQSFGEPEGVFLALPAASEPPDDLPAPSARPAALPAASERPSRLPAPSEPPSRLPAVSAPADGDAPPVPAPAAAPLPAASLPPAPSPAADEPPSFDLPSPAPSAGGFLPA